MTANLPSLLKIAIFFDVHELPFPKNDFARQFIRLWKAPGNLADELKRSPKSEQMGVTLTANGFDDLKREYSFDRMYEVPVDDDLDRTFEASCVVLEFRKKG